MPLDKRPDEQELTWETPMDTHSTLYGTDTTQRPRRTIPPPKSRLRYWIFYLAGILLLGLIVNQYLAWNQELHIVNGYASPLTVSIDEGESVTIGARGHTMVSIGEGDHAAVVSRQGAEDHTVEFTVKNTIYYRVFGDSAFVLNPGGCAVLVLEDVTYSSSSMPTVPPSRLPKPLLEHEDVERAPSTGTPTSPPQAPNPYKMYFGKEFFIFREIDYAFKTPPNKIEVEGASGTKVKKYLSVANGRPVDMINSFPEGTGVDEFFRFAEHFLTVNPDDSDLLSTYTAMVASGENRQRGMKFFGAGLKRRPICVEWHRTYQTLCDTGSDDEIVSMYDRMLSKAPDDSKLLYLRGRLCATRSRSAEYFHRALKADPKNPYPPFAIAYGLMSTGQFDEARKYAATSCKLAPDHAQMKEQLFEIRFALKEYGSLTAELQAELTAKPLDITHHTNLLRTLIAADKTAEAEQANKQYLKRLSDIGEGNEAAPFIGHIKLTLEYLLGDSSRPSSLSPEERNNPDIADRARFIGGLESGDPKRIGELLENKEEWDSGTGMLLLGLAWQVAGDQPAARKCFDGAADKLASGGRDDREAARLLKQGDKLKLSDADELSRNRVPKAMVLAALAAGSPSNRSALLDRAEKLNVLNRFPHHLLRKTIASLRR